MTTSIVMQEKFTNPSFDCYVSELNYAEQIICNNENIAALDRDMSTLYKATLSKFANMPNTQNDLKQSQRKWMRDMRQMTTEQDIEQTYRNRIIQLNDMLGEYVLAIYSYGHRCGEIAAPGTLLEAQSDTMSDKDGYREYMVRYNYLECQTAQTDKLNDEMEKSSPETPCKTNGNTVECIGYREDITTAVCIPINVWNTLAPKSSEKCYETSFDSDLGYYSTEVTCSEEHMNLDKDIYKKTDELHNKIKKCSDYSTNAVFVCNS